VSLSLVTPKTLGNDPTAVVIVDRFEVLNSDDWAAKSLPSPTVWGLSPFPDWLRGGALTHGTSVHSVPGYSA
jgi:hypothetical protein